MKIEFEKLNENHFNEIIAMINSDFKIQATKCPELLEINDDAKLRNLLNFISTQNYSKVVLIQNKVAGFVAFLNAWDGFFGNAKGTFSPFGTSAFLQKNDFGIAREKIISMTISEMMADMVKDGITSFALSYFESDAYFMKTLVLLGFGIRCSDAIAFTKDVIEKTDSVPLKDVCPENISFRELPKDEKNLVRDLRLKLAGHLASSPIFFPTNMETYDQWFKNDDIRVFAAFNEEKIVGFISISSEGETYFSENDSMTNICGTYFDPSLRGTGIPQKLLNYVCKTVQDEGKKIIGVDYETLNPTALNFWTKYFKPYTYSFARRIDERIL